MGKESDSPKRFKKFPRKKKTSEIFLRKWQGMPINYSIIQSILYKLFNPIKDARKAVYFERQSNLTPKR